MAWHAISVSDKDGTMKPWKNVHQNDCFMLQTSEKKWWPGLPHAFPPSFCNVRMNNSEMFYYSQTGDYYAKIYW